MPSSEQLRNNISIAVFSISLLIYIYVHFFVAPGAVQSVSGKLTDDKGQKVVLVTGGAGFIGFHLSLALIEQGHNVYVIDNFNDYYDVRLKIDRAFELHKAGARVYSEDVCNSDFLEELFHDISFTHVAHLAAQAGVRYSLKNPQAYLKANVACQLALLNVLKSQPHIHFVYASSSSVYGKDSTIPFVLTAQTDHPGNMYAATKKTDELLGLHYCSQYGIRAVGLRFFTVYGPWGRPDMSVYLFTEAAMMGKPIPMFHKSDTEPLGRDFTYVSDIIQGVMASLDYRPAQCGEKFNLGFGHPVSLPDMIDILRTELKVNASVEKKPLPPTEILKTWADIQTSEALLNFHPVTNLSTGVKKFVEWYIPYHQARETEKKSKTLSQQEVWFGRLLDEQLQREKRYSQDKNAREQERFFKSFQHEINGCGNNVAEKHSFRMYPGKTFAGYELISYPELTGNIQALRTHCQLLPSCVAFTSHGVLKERVPPKSRWQSDESCDTYVLNKDWCSMHSCHAYATCSPYLDDFYRCDCTSGAEGDGLDCIATRWMPEYFTAELHSVFNVTETKKGQELVFFPEEDSPGGNLMYLKQFKNQPKKLQLECEQNPLCLGFDTRGFLKVRLKPKDSWLKTNVSDCGLYVFDINYCLFSGTECPENAECTHVEKGVSQCTCQQEYIMVNGQCIKLPVDRSVVPTLASCRGNSC